MSSPTTSPRSDRTIWFRAKRIGRGWGLPVAWQGWVVLITWLVIVLSTAPLLAGRHWVGYAIFIAAMAVALVAVRYAKGETPRWRSLR